MLFSPTKFLLPALAPLACVLAGQPAADTAWRDASLGLFHEAHAQFSRSHGREADLGRALTLLQLQPKTAANIREAGALLERLLAENADDEPGVTALYFLGRIEHIHRAPSNPDAAASRYRALIAARPGHPLAGQAAVKLALLELYRPRTSIENRARAFAEFTALAPRQPDAASRRDLHFALGEAALRFNLGEEAALRHFLAALDAGIHRAALRADTLVRVAELARSLGRADIARRHYELFLAGFARDTRRLLVAERLAALPPPAS